MPFTLPKSSTVSVTADINGTKETFPLNTAIAELTPNLTSPTVLDLVKNTSAVDLSKFGDIEYRALAKTKPTVVYKDGKLVQNPADLNHKTVEIKPVRLRPVQISEKIRMSGIDISSRSGYEAALAMHVVNFSDEIRINNEIVGFNNLAFSAQKIQNEIIKVHTEATTFKKGAHVEIKDLNTANDIYNSLSQAKTVIKNIGKANAKTNYDANFKYAKGIDLSNVVCLINDEMLDLLLSRNGIFASDSGLELFKNLRITNVLGINVIPTSNLPEGVNWIMFTVGKMGALGYDKIGNGDWFKFSEDPDWEQDHRLHCSRQQVLGVIYESLIIASFQADTTIQFLDQYGSAKLSKTIREDGEVFEINKSTFKQKVDAAAQAFAKKMQNNNLKENEKKEQPTNTDVDK